MLPQFLKTKTLLDELTRERMFDAMYSSGPLLLEMPSYQQHEGTSGSYQTTRGDIENIDFEKVSVEMVMPSKPGQGVELSSIFDAMAKAGSDMGIKMQENVWKTIERVTEETGNVVTMTNGVITSEALLEMLEKVEIEYDEHGRPRSSFYLSPETAENMMKNFETWRKDPQLMARFAAVEQRKKVEFHAREAARRLAP